MSRISEVKAPLNGEHDPREQTHIPKDGIIELLV